MALNVNKMLVPGPVATLEVTIGDPFGGGWGGGGGRREEINDSFFFSNMSSRLKIARWNV